MIATAEATGQSRFEKNSSHKTLPIIKVREPPSNEGITNSPSAGINTKKHPATTPFLDSGSVISQKARRREHPKSIAASSKELSNFSKLA